MSDWMRWKEEKGKRDDSIEGISSPPFTNVVLQAKLPKDFRLLKLESYDGMGDPLDNARSYQVTIVLHNFKDDILY